MHGDDGPIKLDAGYHGRLGGWLRRWSASGLPVLFAKGVVLGLSIAAPVGPMALLCLRTTLTHGFLPGLMGGMGVAAGDVFYARSRPSGCRRRRRC